MIFIASLHLFFLSSVFAINYILTPKENTNPSLASFYNLEPLVSFNGEFVLYTSHSDHLHKNRNVLSQLYDIEEDQVIHLDSVESVNFVVDSVVGNFIENVPWHLDRISKKKLPLNNTFPYATSGSCHENKDVIIDSYIVDTGIDIEHPQFEKRAVWSANFADELDTDCNNHGTHVAGLIGSKDFGVCVDANLFAVKVLDCDGSGSLSGVIKGIEWVFLKHLEKSKSQSKTIKSIINMSLGGGFSKALNKAVETCINKDNHFYIVVAAGNENKDACFTSPASANSVITVMASDDEDNNAWFSNWGKCANIYAPGVNLASTIPGDNTAIYSGTSMASPVVAGVLNHYLDMYPQHNQKQMIQILDKLSSKNVIRVQKSNTINNLVYLNRMF